MSHIEIKHLKMIKTIAETGNLTRAAEKLCITQPALSRQLLDLESRLQISLFFRTPKQMLLSNEGTRLLESARTILSELATAELAITKSVHGETGRLAIGVQCLYSFQWLPQLVHTFQIRYPKIDLSINSSQTIFDDLMARKIDLGIGAGLSGRTGIRQIDLFKDEMVIIMAPTHPLGNKPFLTAKDFEGLKLISIVPESLNMFYQAVFRPADKKPQQLMVVEHPQGVVELVKAGIGVSLAPRWAVQPQLKAKKLKGVSFTPQGIWVKWRVAHLQNGWLPAHQQKMIELMTEMGLPF